MKQIPKNRIPNPKLLHDDLAAMGELCHGYILISKAVIADHRFQKPLQQMLNLLRSTPIVRDNTHSLSISIYRNFADTGVFKGASHAGKEISSNNAFAYPNGAIFVGEKHIVDAQSESQLALIVAHEIAHVILRHCAKTIKFARRKNIQGREDELRRYMEHTESEADWLGMRIASQAGYETVAAAHKMILSSNNFMTVRGTKIFLSALRRYKKSPAEYILFRKSEFEELKQRTTCSPQ